MAITVESEIAHHFKTSNGHQSAAANGAGPDVQDDEYFMSDVAKSTGEDGSESTVSLFYRR